MKTHRKTCDQDAVKLTNKAHWEKGKRSRPRWGSSFRLVLTHPLDENAHAGCIQGGPRDIERQTAKNVVNKGEETRDGENGSVCQMCLGTCQMAGTHNPTC